MADLKLKMYDWQGKELGTEKLDPALFAVELKPDLVHGILVAQKKNSRQAIAHTKGRAEVRGGGKKPWRQKGTGRARHGSSRSPIWVGGGITFGPTSSRNFSVKVNKKTKAQALTMVLSDKLAADRVILLDSYKLTEPKTQMLDKTVEKLAKEAKSVLIVTKKSDTNIIKAANNLSGVDTIYYGSLNIADLLAYEYLLINKDLLNKLKKQYL